MAGFFTDVVNSDNVVAGDVVNTQLSAGGGGAYTSCGTSYLSVSTRRQLANDPFTQSLTFVGVGSRWHPLEGSSLNAGYTNANTRLPMRVSCSLKNLWVRVTINTSIAPGTATLRIYKNGLQGKGAAVVPIGSTGLFADLVNVDNFSPTDGGNLFFTGDGVNTNITYTQMGAEQGDPILAKPAAGAASRLLGNKLI